MNGTVISWNEERGFGFICPRGQEPERGKDIFVHATELKSKAIGLQPGDSVYFELGEKGGRKRAVGVTVLLRPPGEHTS